MDEPRRKFRLARRLALVAAIQCAATSALADDVPTVTKSKPSSFRSLLAHGWQEGQQNPTAVETAVEILRPRRQPIEVAMPLVIDGRVDIAADDNEDEPIEVAMPLVIAVAPRQPIQTDRAGQVEPPASSTHPGLNNPQAGPSPQLVRPRRELLVTPDSPTAEKPAPIPVPKESFAELVRQRAENIPSAPIDGSIVAEAANVKAEAPSVRRVTLSQRDAKGATLGSEVTTKIQVAEPTPLDLSVAAAGAGKESAGKESAVKESAVKESAVKETTAATKIAVPAVAATKVAAKRVADADVNAILPESSFIPADAFAWSPLRGPIAAEQSSSKGEKRFIQPATPPSLQALAEQQELIASEQSAVESIARSHKYPRLAAEGDFGLSTPQELDNNDANRQALREASSLTATIHASRLQELARESLQTAQHRLQRSAIHSAKSYANEALQSIVVMHDVSDGGTQHAKCLKTALDAIRESEDFCGRFGTIDQSALARMVAVHETDVLKEQDLSDVSPIHATEMYLAAARINLVAAAQDSATASDALVMLGRIERRIASGSDSHSAAVALTLQRAAVEIAPLSAVAHRELGSTLLRQGLITQASDSLQRSIDIQPSQSGYEMLFEVSRRLGDESLARRCIAALNSEQTSSEIAVTKLNPKQFAATYRPNPASQVNVSPVEPTADKAAPATKTPLISKARSWFSFGRRL